MAKHIEKRWWALMVLCLGTLMIVLDTTIVNVALPSIRTELGFDETSLAWVVNAYMLTFGGFLLLGGRLGDLYGHRKLFIGGIVLFTLASLACGLSNTQTMLIIARAIQGLGGAVTSAVALSLMMNLFTEQEERAKAMGIFGFVAAGGGSIGVVLGGLLTSLNWHWIFLVNIPVGVLVTALSLTLLPSSRAELEHRHLDVIGAVTITTALILAVYGVVGGNASGWLSERTFTILGSAALLLGLFVWIESHVKGPLMPLRLFRMRNIIIANIIGVLWAAAMFAWFFISALYLQAILGYDPLHVGLAFLPSNIVMAIFSAWLSAKIVMRFGIRKPITVGLGVAALGLFLFATASQDASYISTILPAMILLGVGAGIAFNPVLLAAMSDVNENESGLASGVVNTSFMMGGALGLAVLASIAASRSGQALAEGADQTNALLSGYHYAFVGGGVFALLAAVLALMLRVKFARGGHHMAAH